MFPVQGVVILLLANGAAETNLILINLQKAGSIKHVDVICHGEAPDKQCLVGGMIQWQTGYKQ